MKTKKISLNSRQKYFVLPMRRGFFRTFLLYQLKFDYLTCVERNLRLITILRLFQFVVFLLHTLYVLSVSFPYITLMTIRKGGYKFLVGFDQKVCLYFIDISLP